MNTLRAVVMLLGNDWRSDSRVIREAKALAASGRAVSVVFQRPEAHDVEERDENVAFQGVHQAPAVSARVAAGLLRVHLQMLSGILRRRARRGPAEWPGVLADLLLHLVFTGVLGTALCVPLVLLYPMRPVAAWAGRLLDWMSVGADGSTGRAVASLRAGWRATILAVAYRPLIYFLQPFLHLNQMAFNARRRLEPLSPNVLHAHDLVTLSAGVAVARRTGCRLVYDAHELETGTNYWSLNRWTRFWIAYYERYLIRETDAVITVSESIADWLQSEYRIARPLVVLNAPDVARRSASETAGPARNVRAALGLADDVPLAVYVGSVTSDRGLEQCVEALAFAPDVHFATVGPRYDVVEQAMKRLAAERGVAARLHLVDPVPADEVVSFIRTADCSVMAIQNVCLSYAYAFPNKLLESVLAGLPVVVADLVEMRRFVERHGGGVAVDQADPRAIAQGMLEVTRNPGRFRPDAAKIAAIAEQYGWPRQRERLVRLYDTLD